MKNYQLLFIILATLLCVSCGQKTLPEPDIKTPVKVKEEIFYSWYANQLTSEGRIKSVSDYNIKKTYKYNELGYKVWYSREDNTKYGRYESESWSYDMDNEDKTLVYDDEHRLVTMYNYDGKFVASFFGNGDVSSQKIYDSDGRLEQYLEFYPDVNRLSMKCTYVYSDNKEVEYRYDDDNGTLRKSFITEKIFDDAGVIIKEKEYLITKKNEKSLSREYTYRNGVLVKNVSIGDYEIEYTYNSYNDVIKEITTTSEYKNNTEYKRKYDRYGNPTLVLMHVKHYYNKTKRTEDRYFVSLYNYVYNDGTKFVAEDEYPDIIYGNSGRSYSDSNNSNEFYRGGNSGYSGGYNNSNSGGNTSYPDNNNSNNTRRRDCYKCNKSGQYTCPCYSVPTFGNTQYHECSNCGQMHKVGVRHTCNCNDCNGNGFK